MEKKNRGLCRFIIFGIIVMLMLSLLIPAGYQFFIVGNGSQSSWSEEVWGSFLGSLWGGIIGGTGTLFAVLITVMETRKIQELNQKTIKKDKTDLARRERKAFADRTIEYVGKYIMDISNYYYGSLSSDRREKELGSIKKELHKKEEEISTQLEKNSEVNTHTVNYTDKLLKNSNLVNKLYLEKDTILRREQEKHTEIKENKVDRVIANECYFILLMMLDKIEIAQDLINQLKYIHNELHGKAGDVINTENEKLREITAQFVSDYVS